MDATFWALIGLILFFVVIFYVKVPAKINGSLDERAETIRKELEDARKMREEAQALLSEYQRKRHEAESEAEAIIAEANSEAERLTLETSQALEEMIARRTKLRKTRLHRPKARQSLKSVPRPLTLPLPLPRKSLQRR